MFADTLSAQDFGRLPLALAAGVVAVQLALQLLSLDRAHRRMLSAVLSGLVLGATAGTVFLLALCAWFPTLRIALPVGSLAVALPLCIAGAIGSIAAIAWGRRGGGRGRALLFGLALPALNVAALACILPIPDWVAATATPDALAPGPLIVVLLGELLAGLLLVHANAVADRRYAARTERENAGLRQLADSAFEGILLHRSGRVLDANAAFCAMAGLPHGAIAGRDVTAFMPDFAAPPGATGSAELELRQSDGGRLPVETLSRELSFGEDAVQVTAVRDISERRAAERSARDRQRVIDLQRETEELRERTRIAAEASRARSTFLAMISHEIRTPMNAVLGLVTALEEEGLPDSQRTVVSAIRESASSLLRLLNDILDFSRLDTGRLTFEAITFSPATLTQEAVSVHGPVALAKGLRIDTDIGADVPAALVGDAGRLRQVLHNLVANAVKFTATGEVVIRVRCPERPDGAARMQWEVCDTGIGVPADRLGLLFAEFVQADDSIARRYGGSGLGLAISRRIIEQMGGTIEAESRPGEGSVFRFIVTLQEAIDPAQAAPATAPGDQGERFRAALGRLGRPMRVLVADDNPTNRFVVRLLLRDFDVTLDMVADGPAAVLAVTATAYDAICMDMLMPEMDGLQTTRAIRNLGGAAAALPIIALTANAFSEDVQACTEAGMTHFVAKPIARDMLLAALEDALAPPRDRRLAQAA